MLPDPNQTPSPVPVAVSPPIPSYIPPFGMRTVVGLLGVLLSVHVAGFNEHITEIGLSDIRGAMHVGHDEGVWFISNYEACNIAAMAFAPWFAITFSIYRFSLCATLMLGLLAIPEPFMRDPASLCVLRAVQGLFAGCLPPMLMTVMLKYLPAPIRVFGIGGYAMSATFGPNLGGPLESLWFEHVGWHWLYWEALPLCALAVLMIAYGLPRDPTHMERLKHFNWFGFISGFASITALVTLFYQGERLDWFNSPFIVHLALFGGALFLGFLTHEALYHSPFFRIQFLRDRNIAMSMMTLVAVLVICGLMLMVPMNYLAEVRGYRPVQTAPIALIVALPQLILLPVTAALCNIRAVDCRYILAGGMGCLALAAGLGTAMTPDWIRDNFYLIQALQIFGQPMVVIPVLMLATMGLGPADGPYISGLVNMLKGLANAVAAAFLETMTRRREQFHSVMLLDHNGNNATALHGFGNRIADQMAAISPDAHYNDGNTQTIFHAFIHAQSLVLGLADIYYVVMWICLFFIVLTAILPRRVYPPRVPSTTAPAH